MPQPNYNQVISEVKALSLTDQLRLLEETAGFIRNNTKITQTRSILELRGKGKDIIKKAILSERPIGQYAGKMKMSDDFNESLPDEFWLGEDN